MTDNQELLSPAFAPDQRSSPLIYSVRTGFLATFMGGPIAGATVALANAKHLGRLRRDWPLALLGLAITVALGWWIARGGPNGVLEDGSYYVLFQLSGLVFFALAYTVHRPYYRAMSTLGLKAPSGWVIGLSAVTLGVIAISATVKLLAR